MSSTPGVNAGGGGGGGVGVGRGKRRLSSLLPRGSRKRAGGGGGGGGAAKSAAAALHKFAIQAYVDENNVAKPACSDPFYRGVTYSCWLKKGGCSGAPPPSSSSSSTAAAGGDNVLIVDIGGCSTAAHVTVEPDVSEWAFAKSMTIFTRGGGPAGISCRWVFKKRKDADLFKRGQVQIEVRHAKEPVIIVKCGTTLPLPSTTALSSSSSSSSSVVSASVLSPTPSAAAYNVSNKSHKSHKEKEELTADDVSNAAALKRPIPSTLLSSYYVEQSQAANIAGGSLVLV